MKYLVAYAVAEGTPQTTADNARKRFECVFIKTMGQVAKDLFDEVLTSNPPPYRNESPNEIFIHSRFSIDEPGPDGWAPFKSLCEQVVKARNEQVHHLLRQWPRDTEAALRELLAHLDGTHDIAESVLSELKHLVGAQAEARQTMASHLASAEGQAELQVQLALGNVVAAFREIAAVKSREDGWVIAAGAISRLYGDQRLKDDVEILKQRWGKKGWWRQVLAESPDEFELSEEPIPSPTSPSMRRTIYRLRDGHY